MPKYSIDASAILDAWVRYYPFDLFPSFWNKFKELVTSDGCVAIELIEHEINKKDDGCGKWFNENNLNHFFVAIGKDIQAEVSEMMKNKNYQRLVEDRKGVFGADPFVIAFAKVENLTVVTGERANNNISKPKIPDVCNDMGIDCINILDLMRREKWIF
jgi:hypothetical protein